MNYKVGDEVVVREWGAILRGREPDRDTGSIGGEDWIFYHGMRQFCGRIAVIRGIDEGDYRLNIDNCEHFWTDEMLRPYFEYGEEIEVRDDGEGWEKGEYVAFIDGYSSPYVCIASGVEKQMYIYHWEEARKINQISEDEVK